MIPILTTTEFNTHIARGITLVDFWAPWCNPCKNLMPILETMPSVFPEVKFTKVNADEVPNVVSDWSVSSLPTLLLFKDGKLVNKHVGAPSRSQLKNFIESVI